MKVLLANKFLFNNGGAEAVLLQERLFLMSSGTDVVDFAMQHDRNIESSYAAHFVSHQEYRSGGYLGKVKSALSLIHSREAVSKLASLIRRCRRFPAAAVRAATSRRGEHSVSSHILRTIALGDSRRPYE